MIKSTHFRAYALMAMVLAGFASFPSYAGQGACGQSRRGAGCAAASTSRQGAVNVERATNVPVTREALERAVQTYSNTMREADGALVAYLRDSIGSMQQGHENGILQFRVWYRNYERERDPANDLNYVLFEQLMQAVSAGLLIAMGDVAPGVLARALPGAPSSYLAERSMLESGARVVESGGELVVESATPAPGNSRADQIGESPMYRLVMDTIRRRVTSATNITSGANASSATNDGPGGEHLSEAGIDGFLDQVQAAEWRVVQSLQEVPTQFRAQYPDVFRAAQQEYVYANASAQTSTVPPSARRYLSDVGVLEPGMSTSERVKVGVLATHIEKVYMQDPQRRAMWVEGNIPIYARIHALQYLGVQENAGCICRLQSLVDTDAASDQQCARAAAPPEGWREFCEGR